MRYQIYCAGYQNMVCLPCPSAWVGTAEGDTFQEACANMYALTPDGPKYYDPVRNTYWGLKLGQTLAEVAIPGELENGPDVSDGLDSDGFEGGDRRANHYPTTRESALNALLDFIPKECRSEIEDMFRDILNTVDEENPYDEGDEEE